MKRASIFLRLGSVMARRNSISRAAHLRSVVTSSFRIAFCLGVLAVAVPAFATESESSHFKQAKTGLQTQLRSRMSETRIAAIQELSGFQELPAAKLILQLASKDADPAVRKAARLALHEFKDNSQVCEHFAALVGKDTRKKVAAEGTLALAEVLLCTEDPALHEPSLAYLDRAVAPSRDGPLMLFALVEE